jgi:hypothetical protein
MKVFEDLTKLSQIAEDLYLSHIVVAYPEHGERAYKELTIFLKRLYGYFPPDKAQILVFKAFENERISTHGEHISVSDLSILPQIASGDITLQFFDNGDIFLWKGEIPKIETLIDKGLIYLYSNKTDYFFAKENKLEVFKLSTTGNSIFAEPSFNDLREALEYYKINRARFSNCSILQKAWRDEKRFFFKNAAEDTLQDSLHSFLATYLRRAKEVKREQNVDESHPVDIRITWYGNFIAIIEIKWLGKSKDEYGTLKREYTPVDARDGAKQLADYLDEIKQRTSDHTIKGYLVVFDGRRKGLSAKTAEVDRKNAYHYADQEIEYNPKFHEDRDYFEEPIRMFMEPKFV